METEYRCLGSTENRFIIPPLVVITLPESCLIFSGDFIIPAVNSFTPKLPIALWGYQSDPFLNKSDPLFNFKLISDFKLDNLMKKI